VPEVKRQFELFCECLATESFNADNKHKGKHGNEVGHFISEFRLGFKGLYGMEMRGNPPPKDYKLAKDLIEGYLTQRSITIDEYLNWIFKEFAPKSQFRDRALSIALICSDAIINQFNVANRDMLAQREIEMKQQSRTRNLTSRQQTLINSIREHKLDESLIQGMLLWRKQYNDRLITVETWSDKLDALEIQVRGIIGLEQPPYITE